MEFPGQERTAGDCCKFGTIGVYRIDRTPTIGERYSVDIAYGDCPWWWRVRGSRWNGGRFQGRTAVRISTGGICFTNRPGVGREIGLLRARGGSGDGGLYYLLSACRGGQPVHLRPKRYPRRGRVGGRESPTAFSALDPVHDTITMAPITPGTSTSNFGRIESNGYRFRSKYFLERCTCVTTWRHYLRVYPRVHRSARTLTRGCGQAFFDSKSSEMSIARGEWVSAPTEIISTPLFATSATFSSVIPPDASTVDPAPI